MTYDEKIDKIRYRCHKCGELIKNPEMHYFYPWGDDKPEKEYWTCPNCGGEIRMFLDREDIK